ncbi:acyl carrier protein phosphodiesterase [Dinghuibacter silviterrae]|uniref:acyl carrier protein phosphodiesterase n=1 Tax=Dinghuibacter silviterrae TaxID=1539049 RepID=UPI001FE46866|nr:ACP phosphodiesterase [Dinghuibacter silviterrae]
MNYLAHAYLSFGSDVVLVGNMVSDFVKGKSLEAYPVGIQKGIRLHRRIDDFTDAHPVFKEARQLLAPAVGRYSGAFLDIIFDHFLATDRFTTDGLAAFSQHVYSVIRKEETLLPPAFVQMFNYMVRQDWLYHYATREGIRRSLEGMVRRAKYVPAGAPIYALFERHYEALGDSYRKFFPELEAYAREHFAL